MFDELLDVILHAPMAFFDTTPIGRIMNRFSKDMYTVDEQLVVSGRSYFSTMAQVLSTIVVVTSVTPKFIFGLVPLLFFYLHQQNFFTMTYRELKRLDSVTRSPIYALLSETLDGVLTIRAFGAEENLNKRMINMINVQQTAYRLTYAAQCWLSVRLEFCGTMLVFVACFVSVIQHGTRGGDELFAGLAGLSISFALSITQALNWTVRMASDLEANMVAGASFSHFLFSARIFVQIAHYSPSFCSITSFSSCHSRTNSAIFSDCIRSSKVDGKRRISAIQLACRRTH